MVPYGGSLGGEYRAGYDGFYDGAYPGAMHFATLKSISEGRWLRSTLTLEERWRRLNPIFEILLACDELGAIWPRISPNHRGNKLKMEGISDSASYHPMSMKRSI